MARLTSGRKDRRLVFRVLDLRTLEWALFNESYSPEDCLQRASHAESKIQTMNRPEQ